MENNQSAIGELLKSDRIRADAMELVDKAKTAAREQLESGKQLAARQGAKVAAVLEQASSQLKKKELRTLADYTSDLGSRIKTFSGRLRKRNDLATNIREIARRNPKVFLLGVIVIGIGAYRICKASAARRRESKSQEHDAANKPSDEPGRLVGEDE
jgi:hypothetical protein